QEVEAVDACRVAVRPADGDGVAAHRLDRFGGHRPAGRLVADRRAGVPLAHRARAPGAHVVVVVLGDVTVAPGQAQPPFLRQPPYLGQRVFHLDPPADATTAGGALAPPFRRPAG